VYLAELSGGGDWPFVLDLHPRLTVVAGLGAERRHLLAGLVNDALRGRLADIGARVEFDGESYELTAELLAQLGIPPDTDVVLRATDLPGARPLDTGDVEIVLDASTRPAAVDDTGAGEPQESAELAEARVALFRAREAVSGAEAALAAARTALDPDAPAAMVAAEDALEVARRVRDEAAARVRAAQAALDTTAHRDAPAGEAGAPDGDRRRSALEQRRQELVVALTATAATDPTRVAEAQAELRRIEALEPRPVPEAQDLADAWVELEARRAQLPPPRRAPRSLVESAREALEKARADVVRAEEGARLAELSPQDVAAIEAAHAAVVDAGEKIDGKRMAGPLSRRRLEAAQAAEEALLRRLDLASYQAFLLRTAPGLTRPIENEHLARARAALADAEAVWEELHAPGPDEKVARALLAESDRLRAEAVALLGADPGRDVEGALRALRRPAEDPRAAREALRAALEAVGASLDPAVDGGDPAAAAAAWLACADEDHARRAALEAELGGLQADMDRVAREADPAGGRDERHATGGGGGDASAAVQVRTRLQTELEEAQTALDAATDHEERARQARNQASVRLEDGRSAELRVASLTEELSGATAAHEQAAARVQELEGAAPRRRPLAGTSGAPAAPEVDVSEVDAEVLEVYLLARLVAQRSVGQAGGLPLVIDDAFVDLPVETIERAVGVLERFTTAFQFIYLSDDPEIEAWARLFGPKGASVRRFSSA
jgi:hypothetical protein